MTNLEKYQRSILATLLNEPEIFDSFSALCDLVKWQEPYDQVYKALKSGSRSFYLVLEKLDIPDTEKFMTRLVKERREPFLSDLIIYCVETTNRNAAIEQTHDLIQSAPDLHALNRGLNAITAHISTLYRVTTYDMEKLNIEQIKAVEKQRAGGVVSLKCGLQTLQYQLMGWHPGHLTVIGANSSAGKTAFALTCLREAAEANDCPVAIVSYEMTPREIHARLAAQLSEVQPREILYTQLTDDQFSKLHQGIGKLEKLKIFVERPEDSDIETLISKIRYLVSNGVKIIAVDYLQLIRDKTIRDKYAAIGNISRRLKNAAIEFDISIIVLSQLNRNNFKEVSKRPTLASLRDSGEIEEAADEVILLYREEYFTPPEDITPDMIGKVEVIFAKGRSTGIGMSIMKYEKEYTRFVEERKDHAELRDYTEPARNLKPTDDF